MTGRELEILRKSGIRRNGEVNRQCLIFRNPKRGLREEAKKVVAGMGMDSYPMPSKVLKLSTTPIRVLTVSDETKRATFEMTKVPQFKTSGQEKSF